jgi:hypothetical protein
MAIISSMFLTGFRRSRGASLAACGAVLLCVAWWPVAAVAQAISQPGAEGGGSAPNVTATLEECMTTGAQSERSATFSGEMTALPGTQRMAMRIEVLERLPGEALFHVVSAPGLGVWRGSASGVKTYKYLKQVTNLSAPAFFRALVRFRWLNARGHLLRRAERRTLACDQPAPIVTPGGSTTPGGSPTLE